MRFGWISIFCISTAIFCSLIVQGISEAENSAARKFSPGITTNDINPEGCVGCHINSPGEKKDMRLSSLMEKWTEGVDKKHLQLAQKASPLKLKGKHPPVKGIFSNIPKNCFKCHDKAFKSVPPLGGMLHLFHLSGGRKNAFLSKHDGGCTHCHKIDFDTGLWSIPSGAEK